MAEPDQLEDVFGASELVGAVIASSNNDMEEEDGAKNLIAIINDVKMRKVQSESALDTKSDPPSDDDCRPSTEEENEDYIFQQGSPNSEDEDENFDVFEFIDLNCRKAHPLSDNDCHPSKGEVNALQQCSTSSNNEDFDVLQFTNWERQKSVAVQLWDFVLGATALLDFTAAMASRPKNFFAATISSRMEPWHVSFWTWLGQHSNEWSICFSLFWAVDSFVEAHRRRLQDVRERDRQRLLNLNDSSSELSSVSETTLKQEDNDWFRGSRGVYYRTIFRQLILLPVGFYVVVSHGLRKLNDPVLTDGEHYDIRAVLDETYLFYSRASVSLIVALARYGIFTVGSITDQHVRHVRLQAIERAKRVGIIALRRAIRNPFRSYRRANKLLRLVRWIKYLGPVFGTLNKLVGNLLDLLDKHKQRSVAKRASAERRKRWHNLSKEELREHCATFIQKTFRANQSRRRMRLIRLMRRDAEIVAAVKLQNRFRASLRRARARLKDKMLELQKLKEQSGKAEMSSKQRRRMYQLQEELKAKTRSLLNEKLLLRPNTSFAVRWRILLVLTVLFEISILVCRPFIARHKDPATGKPMDIETFLDRKLATMQISKLSVCKPDKHSPKKHFPLTFIAGVVRERPLRTEKIKATNRKPYYCSSAYASLLHLRAFGFLCCEYLLAIFFYA